MSERSAPIVVTPRACPFVALDGDRDRRLEVPDPLHRCFAEPIPRARSVGHQAEFCLSPAFPTCPIFQDWASRAAADPVIPRVSTPTAVPSAASTPTGASDAPTSVARSPGAAPAPDLARRDMGRWAGPAVAGEPDPVALDEVIATRPVPSYRAVPATGPVPASTTTGSTPVIGGGPDVGVPRPQPLLDPGTPDVEPPMTRGVPRPSDGAHAVPPMPDDDWMAPPPWLRPPTGPVWVAEAVPPPDALADVGTQGLRRGRAEANPPPALAEAAVPTGMGSLPWMSGTFGEDTTGAPSVLASSAGLATPSWAPAPIAGGTASTRSGIAVDLAIETQDGDARPMDPGLSAELAASRYRADLAAGLESGDDGDDVASRAASAQRRVPIDVAGSSTAGPHARPSARSTGSREWEGPRRFEAYAATQRRRPPPMLIAGGGAVILAALLVGVFLLPGMLMGGAPAATGTPAPTELTAAIVATRPPSEPTLAPERTERPDKTAKPRSYTVRSGDTLIKIAKRFKTSVAKVSCLNRIRNPNNVVVGRTLLIPPKGYRCRDG